MKTNSAGSEIIAQFERKIESLEKRLSSIENSPCKCNQNTNPSNRESIENELNRFAPVFKILENEYNKDDMQSTNIDFLRLSVNFYDKISDIERIIREDRLLVEQLFVNQMNEIQQRIEIQEDTIKSCETLMELQASNDSLVNAQFNDIE